VEGVLVFSFHEFKVKGSKVIVEFGYSESRKHSISAEGIIYRYNKVSGKWIGWAIKGWTSIAE
jgi:hypothetical protein